MNKFLIFPETVKIVEGVRNSLIVDFERNLIFPIPIDFASMIKSFKETNLALVENSFENESDYKLYLDFLIQNEMCFYSDEGMNKNFNELENYFDFPSTITNAILYYNNETLHALYQLESLLCYHLEIVFLEITLEELRLISDLLRNFSFESVNLIIGKSEITQIELEEILQENFVISVIFHFASEQNKVIEISSLQNSKIIYTKSEFISKRCGAVQLDYFSLNRTAFLESLHHNSCLNRKISIDAEGNIKNCPSMTESFGNIKDTTLAEAIEKPGFKKYWDINKDKIHVCKDCEFRYICTDCRAYVEDPADILSKPLKCGYNPYTGEWSEWSTNPLKQKAIDFYGMREIVEEMKSKAAGE